MTLTAVPGIRVGHASDLSAATGCTAVLCPENTVGAVDVRGGAPGTRETDLLQPQNMIQYVNAVILAGGSAFGLAAADGVMRYLSEKSIGYKTGSGAIVPIVPAAILFDLSLGRSDVYPDASMGYAACEAANGDAVVQGSVGAGTGAMCGAMMGPQLATKGGIGSVSIDLGKGLVVAALIVVNAVGDIVNEQGQVIAGLLSPDGGFTDTLSVLKTMAHASGPTSEAQNTVIGVVATNARLDKAQATKVAQMAHDGIARAVRPAHTPFDGDTIFCLATGEHKANPAVIGAYAAEVVATSIRRAVLNAEGLQGVRSASELRR